MKNRRNNILKIDLSKAEEDVHEHLLCWDQHRTINGNKHYPSWTASRLKVEELAQMWNSPVTPHISITFLQGLLYTLLRIRYTTVKRHSFSCWDAHRFSESLQNTTQIAVPPWHPEKSPRFQQEVLSFTRQFASLSVATVGHQSRNPRNSAALVTQK